MKNVAATSGQSVSLAILFFAWGIAREGSGAGSDNVLNFTLDPPKANAQSHRTRATSHSQNTRSISARNNKMHLPQKIFESPNATTLIRPTRFIECGGLFDSMKAS